MTAIPTYLRCPVLARHLLGALLLLVASASAAEREPAIFSAHSSRWRPQPAVPVVPSAPQSTPTAPQPVAEQVSAVPAIPPQRPLSDISIDIRPQPGDEPANVAGRYFAGPPLAGNTDRGWAEFTHAWEAPGLYHLPLYFEDVALERYGHSDCPFFQPVVSAAWFFGTVPLLPYQMGLEPPLEHVHALGYYRPGSYAPRLIYPIPLRADAALLEAGVVTGLIFLIP